MQYTKSPLTLEEQAELLLKRNLIADKAELINILKHINYYRLTGYLYPFRISQSNDQFRSNTTLEQILKIYTFDSEFKNLLLRSLEKIEVSLKTNFAYCFSHDYEPFKYTDINCYPKISADKFNSLIDKIKKATVESKEDFVIHFNKTYGDKHKYLPVWMLVEIITFGSTITFMRYLNIHTRKKIAKVYNITPVVLISWIMSLNTVRNICAHHGRLWNKKMTGFEPLIPNSKNNLKWLSFNGKNNKIYMILTIIKHMLDKINPNNTWKNDIKDLLAKYPDISPKNMGFPDDWTNDSIWL